MLLYGDRVDSWTPFYQQGHNAVLSQAHILGELSPALGPGQGTSLKGRGGNSMRQR